MPVIHHSPMQWDELKALFQQAIERPPAEWPAIVQKAAATDPALAAKLQAMLDAQAAAPSFLEAGALASSELPSDDDAPSLSAGTRVGPYTIGALIGRGGMGEVYQATDTRLRREVAIKILPAAVSRDSAWCRRMEREARAAGMLSHPHIVTVFDVGEHDGAPFIVSELLEGVTLRTLLEQRQAAFSPDEAIRLIADVASGLAAAHDRSLVHRDLKPENIFVTRDQRVKILDFGIAKLLTDDSSTTTLTRTGAMLGTVGYMAPEQVRGAAIGPPTDIFALGAILYEMLAGRRAFARSTSVETLGSILRDEPPPLASLSPGIPKGVAVIVERCLAKAAADRFPNGQALHAALAVYLKQPSAVAASRRWLVSGVAVAAGIALVVVLAFAWRRPVVNAPVAGEQGPGASATSARAATDSGRSEIRSFYHYELGSDVEWRQSADGRSEMRLSSSRLFGDLGVGEWLEQSAFDDQVRAGLARRAGLPPEVADTHQAVERSSYNDKELEVRVEWRKWADGTTQYRIPISWLKPGEHPGAWVSKAVFESRQAAARRSLRPGDRRAP